MKRLTLLLCLLVALESADLCAQSKAELKNNFFDAESWVLFEAYKDALPLYLQLLDHFPDNYNFKYRIGECYLNIPGAKDKAISYLEEASTGINPLHKEGKYTEKGAPYDVLYYLANAYRLNNQLDKAVETYGRFKKVMNSETYDSVVVNLQILSCQIAKELMAKPVEIRKSSLGDVINSGNSVFNPVMSDREDMLVYTRNEAFYDALLYSVKQNGEWQPPKNMNEILKVDRDIFPSSLSSDGKTLYLYSSADYDGVIYTSLYENQTWMPLVKLNDNINTRYWESHATVSHDDRKLYFTSNRKGSFGGLDIFVSARDSTGDWGPAMNVGPVINTPYNEESPFLSKDDKTLYFSSRGHYNMGGYDIFSSRLMADGQWTEPVNEGYPLNTTDDDIFFKPAIGTGKAFYATSETEGSGRQEIYQIDILSGSHKKQYIVYGTSVIKGMNNLPADSIKLTVTSYDNPAQTLTSYTNPLTHSYSLSIPYGEYKVDYEGRGADKVTRSISLPSSYVPDSFMIPAVELTRNDFIAELSVDTTKKITVSQGDSIYIPLKVEPLSMLTVESYIGNKLIHSEKYNITSPEFRYKIAPENGDNKIVFNLTDRFNNSSTSEVHINRVKGKAAPVKPVKEKPVAEKQVAEKQVAEKQVAEKQVTEKQVAEKISATEPVAEKPAVQKPESKIVRPEYQTVIAKKQTNAYLSLLINRSDENLKKLINDTKAGNRQFKKPDDVLQFLTSAAAQNKVPADEIAKAALRVAITDNVVTKSALGLLASYSGGEIKSVLDSLDIDKYGIRTWSDLQQYASEKSSNRIVARDLNDQASIILGESDPAISMISDKLLALSEKSNNNKLIREGVNSTNVKDLKLREKWLEAFWADAKAKGIQTKELSEILVIISSNPGTGTGQYVEELLRRSVEPVTSSLKSEDLRKDKIKSPAELIYRITNGSDLSGFPEDAVFRSIANLIVSSNIPAETFLTAAPVGPRGNHWIAYAVPAIIVAALVIIYYMLKRKKKDQTA